MKELKLSGQFKKDLKRIQNNPKKIAKLKTVLHQLRETGSVSPEFKPHLLVGNYKGYMECHIEGDLLLIWMDESKDIIKLTRLGSHSELFKK